MSNRKMHRLPMVNGKYTGKQTACSKPDCDQPIARPGQRYCRAHFAEAMRNHRRSVKQNIRHETQEGK